MGRVPQQLKQVSKTRLDTLLVERGVAVSRERARALILAGQVRVDGTVVSKAGAAVPADADISLVRPDHPYVGRGGVKLACALDAWPIPVSGRDALDIGASTGGFTDVLLRRGARSVIALDVGRGQLDWTLRNDPRVIVIEGVNARTLAPDSLPHLVDIVTIDVSFISLRLIIPRVPPLLLPCADVVALVKPQFEAGREEVGRKGLVRDPAVHERVLAEVRESASEAGLRQLAVLPSTIKGAEGNQEFLVHFRPDAL